MKINMSLDFVLFALSFYPLLIYKNTCIALGLYMLGVYLKMFILFYIHMRFKLE